MDKYYAHYKHLLCDDPACEGIVKMVGDVSDEFVCMKCKKSISWRYVMDNFDIFMKNPMTGWVFPMIKKNKDTGYKNNN